MYYLVDTNVFLHSIRDEIFPVADFCKKNGTEITITETIINELEPGYYIEMENKKSREVYNSVNNLTHGTMGLKVIRLVNLNDIEGAAKELKIIRERFYGWMKDANYLQKLISKNAISAEDIKRKSFRKKDLGECELIAIAKVSKDEYNIVSNDKGRVFLHPEQNLFKDYAIPSGIIVLDSNEWLHKLNFQVT